MTSTALVCGIREIFGPCAASLSGIWNSSFISAAGSKVLKSRDPFLSVQSLSVCAEKWKDGLDAHDWHVSPIYGDLKGIRNVTVFVGTSEIFFPDVTKFFRMLDRDPSNVLIIGDEMNHVYPLFPIPEAKSAVDRIFQAVAR